MEALKRKWKLTIVGQTWRLPNTFIYPNSLWCGNKKQTHSLFLFSLLIYLTKKQKTTKWNAIQCCSRHLTWINKSCFVCHIPTLISVRLTGFFFFFSFSRVGLLEVQWIYFKKINHQYLVVMAMAGASHLSNKVSLWQWEIPFR